MNYYTIQFENGMNLEIDLESMYLTPEMAQEIVQDNAPEDAHLSWDLHRKGADGEWSIIHKHEGESSSGIKFSK